MDERKRDIVSAVIALAIGLSALGLYHFTRSPPPAAPTPPAAPSESSSRTAD